jgi:hypothetical protein
MPALAQFLHQEICEAVAFVTSECNSHLRSSSTLPIDK